MTKAEDESTSLTSNNAYPPVRYIPYMFLSRREYCGRVAVCVASRLVSLHAIRDSRYTMPPLELNALEALLGLSLLPRASCRADGRPYTGPGILTCAHLAGVDPASGR